MYYADGFLKVHCECNETRRYFRNQSVYFIIENQMYEFQSPNPKSPNLKSSDWFGDWFLRFGI